VLVELRVELGAKGTGAKELRELRGRWCKYGAKGTLVQKQLFQAKGTLVHGAKATFSS